ncbi:MAG: mannitol dehydrogenase family protein [Rubellimicrobium sp.]|nr:mannitol dehydrogenase family protein [Rubellimicrobium sp.]
MTTAEVPLRTTGWRREDARAGLVHLGYGAFHRAHQAVVLDDYMEATGDLDWGIAAVNLRASESAAFADACRAEGGYLLKTTTPGNIREYRLVRSHLEFADWAEDPAPAEALLARPGVRAVTITVTESGYSLDPAGNLNPADPVIADELAGGAPRSVYAYLARGLGRRMAAGAGPITLLCCDNIRANGHMLRRNLTDYLHRAGRQDLAEWLGANARFPCSMVDRITPRADAALVSEIAQLFPARPLAPIHAEAFLQWVLEEDFAGPFPDLRKAEVEVVADVDPYEEAKIRILNGGHTGLCYLGALAGHRTFDQAMADTRLRLHFEAWQDEVLAGLTIDLPFDRQVYRARIAERFSNAAIADQLARICMDGWSKMPIFIRPTLDSCLAQGIVPRAGLACVASWYVYARRFARGVMAVPYVEPAWDDLSPLLAPGREGDFARRPELWGDLPETRTAFVPGLLAAIEEMERAWPA